MTNIPAQFERLPEGIKWPAGDYVDVAILPINAERVVSTLGFPLLEGVEEGLGPWAAAGIRFKSGAFVEIISYAYQPGLPGFVLRVDAAACLKTALEDVVLLFGLRRNSLPWVSPRIQDGDLSP